MNFKDFEGNLLHPNSKCYDLVFNSSVKDLEENKKKAKRLLAFTKKASECFYQVSKIESLRKEYSDVL